MAPITYFEHHGPYDTHTRTSPALRFLENYTRKIDSADYSGSYLPYYHPRSTFHDTTGVDYVGGPAIWKWIDGLFGTFSRILMEGRHFIVASSVEDGTHVVYCEWYAHWWLVGKDGRDGEKITIPRSMVFTLGKAEGDGGEAVQQEVGFEGLQILDARLYYDRSLLLPHLRKSKQEIEKFGESAGR